MAPKKEEGELSAYLVLVSSIFTIDGIGFWSNCREPKPRAPCSRVGKLPCLPLVRNPTPSTFFLLPPSDSPTHSVGAMDEVLALSMKPRERDHYSSVGVGIGLTLRSP
jgi:hypothetical protein